MIELFLFGIGGLWVYIMIRKFYDRQKKFEDDLYQTIDYHIRKNIRKEMDNDLKMARMSDEIKMLRIHMRDKKEGNEIFG
jgi:hypothetical protein